MKIHGDYKIKVVGEIFILRLYNSWNEDCSKAFLNDYKNIILEKEFKQFGVLVDLRKVEGATPESIKLFQNITTWAYEHGQIARAIVYNSELKRYIGELALNDGLFPSKAFGEDKTAMVWLKLKGLKSSKS